MRARAQAFGVAAATASLACSCTLLTDTSGLSGGVPDAPGAGAITTAPATSGRTPGTPGGGPSDAAAGAVPFVIADDDYVGEVVADDDGVYWTSSGLGDVRRAAVDGSKLVTVFHGDRASGSIAIDGTRIYWTERGAGNLRSVHKDADHGALDGELTDQGDVRGIAVSGDAVFFFDNASGTIEETSTALRSAMLFAIVDDVGRGVVLDLRATSDEVFYGVSGPSINVVRRIPRGPLIGEEEDVTPKVSALGGYAIDGARVYFGVADTGLIESAAIDGRSPMTHASSEPGVSAIAVDDAYIYWTRPGLVRRVPKVGGEPETLATGQAEPYSLTVNRYGVYWATADQRLMGMRMRK